MDTLPLLAWTLIGVPFASLFVCQKLDQVRARGWIAARLTM